MKEERNRKPKVPLRVRFARFMAERNGPDALGRTVYYVLLLSLLLRLFIDHFSLYVVQALLLFIYFYRFFSKNRVRRARENQRYLSMLGAIRRFFALRRRRFRDRKTHVYKRCPTCHRTLRLPKRRGTHTAVCPMCAAHFSVKIR